MNLFNTAVGIVLNLLFPKNNIEKKIECTTPEHLLRKLSLNNRLRGTDGYALFDYRDTLIKNMIWLLKYKKNQKVALLFAQILYDFLMEEFSDLALYSRFEKPLLIPIPMYKTHLRERGYNQTEFLAEKFCTVGGDSFCTLDTHILRKIKDTSSQTKLHKNERLKNIIGVFEVVDTEKIQDKNILLLDDVITTGATLNEARKVLLQAGAKRVLCVALAH